MPTVPLTVLRPSRAQRPVHRSPCSPSRSLCSPSHSKYSPVLTVPSSAHRAHRPAHHAHRTHRAHRPAHRAHRPVIMCLNTVACEYRCVWLSFFTGNQTDRPTEVPQDGSKIWSKINSNFHGWPPTKKQDRQNNSTFASYKSVGFVETKSPLMKKTSF